MAKRKPTTRTIATGIYTRTETRTPLAAVSLKDFAQAAMAAASYRKSPDRLQDLLADAERVVKLVYAVPAGEWRTKTMGHEAETRRDACLLSIAINGVQVMLRCGKTAEALPLMFDVGFLLARIEVRPFERFVAEKDRAVAAMQHGNDTAWDDRTKKAALKLYRDLQKKGLLAKQAAAKVNEQFSVPYRSLRRWAKESLAIR